MRLHSCFQVRDHEEILGSRDFASSIGRAVFAYNGEFFGDVEFRHNYTQVSVFSFNLFRFGFFLFRNVNWETLWNS